jgi:hypothetical protein
MTRAGVLATRQGSVIRVMPEECRGVGDAPQTILREGSGRSTALDHLPADLAARVRGRVDVEVVLTSHQVGGLRLAESR